MYKAICQNCNGNGYERIKDAKGKTNVHQCWMCESTGEINGLKLKLMSLFIILTFASGCSEFALLASGASIAASQNAYTRIYSGVDVLTIMSTDKDIKRHVYENVKDLYDKTKY